MKFQKTKKKFEKAQHATQSWTSHLADCIGLEIDSVYTLILLVQLFEKVYLISDSKV